MKSHEIRQAFLDFYESKNHKIVPSAPLVNKDDPTLMFINAGMAPFKDYFLGNKAAVDTRVADTQKCLRVSGKHNDLEEVGVDGYHHTMFEMLGNWSFGDYFKKEAIAWAWELLTEVYKIPKEDLYVSVFEGDKADGLEADFEAIELWKNWISEDRILRFDRKDNFWEMGETGPCGPCSEIHVDLRTAEEKAKISGKSLVNADHPQVVEIWNLVFIQFERKADKSLIELPSKHIDTGMGFERLTMALQRKTATYDTDIFTASLQFLEQKSGFKYGSTDSKRDIAFRVIVDHIRAVSFTIADGQLPSNTGAGYVIRRILRRAVRYYYSFLDIQTPLLYELMDVLADEFKNVFPELDAQRAFVKNIILKEEESFLRTLGNGLKRLDAIEITDGILNGETAFELYDTFGFPFDLTQLVLSEKGIKADELGFDAALKAQRERGKKDAQKEVGDWEILTDDQDVTFVGYDNLETASRVVKHRTVKAKKKNEYQIVLDTTPFYPEGGGQVGDKGYLFFGEERIEVIDTKKENDLIIHAVKKLPTAIDVTVKAVVNAKKRQATENVHSATHLLHAALRNILGTHVAQKGSLVEDNKLRFDFSHFDKITDEQLAEIEKIVNVKIRENIALEEARDLPIAAAKASGAMMLFGEKYGETVRMITFDKSYSQELCGGCHVKQTGQIGLFKIISESSVAAGVRRVEAVTAEKAEAYLATELAELNAVRDLFKNAKNIAQTVERLQAENKELQKQVEELYTLQAQIAKAELKAKVEQKDGVNFIISEVEIGSADALKNLAFQLDNEVENLFFVAGANIGGKPNLTIFINKDLVETKGYNAGKMIREIAKEIKGGGGGQPFFASAGGNDVSGIERALAKAKTLV
jgi:alanyl-tRNA synthetase